MTLLKAVCMAIDARGDVDVYIEGCMLGLVREYGDL